MKLNTWLPIFIAALWIAPSSASANATPESHACLFGSNLAPILANHHPDFTVTLLGRVTRANARHLEETATPEIRGALDTLKFNFTGGDPAHFDLRRILEDNVNPREGVLLYQILHRPSNHSFFGFLVHDPGSAYLRSWYLRIDFPYSPQSHGIAQPLAQVDGESASLNSPYSVSSCGINVNLERTWTSR